MILLADAAARGDSVVAERAWRAVERAFVEQVPGGAHRSTLPGSDSTEVRIQDLSGTALWLGELERGIVALQNGPLSKRFGWRITLLLPKARRSVDWLADRIGEWEATRAGRDAPALLAGAQAMLLADGIWHDPRYNQIGQRLLVSALALQGKDGSFSGERPPDAGRQALCLNALQELDLYFPAPFLARVLEPGTRWLRANSGARQAIAGLDAGLFPPGTLDRPQPRVALALEYLAARSGETSARSDADRFFARAIGPRPR